MISDTALKGRWNELKGQLKQKWGQLTDNELANVEGQGEQLIGLIQRKTGETRESIQRWLDQRLSTGSSNPGSASTSHGEAHHEDSTDSGAGSMERLSESAHQMGNRIGGYVQDSAHRAEELAQEGFSQAREMVQEKPMQSVGVAFVAGLVTGVVVGMLLAPRPQSRWFYDPRR